MVNQRMFMNPKVLFMFNGLEFSFTPALNMRLKLNWWQPDVQQVYYATSHTHTRSIMSSSHMSIQPRNNLNRSLLRSISGLQFQNSLYAVLYNLIE